MRRLKPKDVPGIKAILKKKQGNKCLLCRRSFDDIPDKDVVLDHDHRTGCVRGVLCRNCNGMEGKIWNRANRAKQGMTVIEWTTRLVKYWELYCIDQTGLLHPTHKTEAEKKAAVATKARLRRAQAKASATVKGKSK